MVKTEVLRQLYLFKDMSDSELELIKSAAELKKFGPGDEITCQGEPAKALFLIEYGSVKVHVHEDNDENIEVSRLGSGSHFGEMPFLDGEPRSATATALEPSEIVVIDYNKLGAIMAEHLGVAVHFYKQFAHFLCGRLRHTTKDMAFARSQVVSHF